MKLDNILFGIIGLLIGLIVGFMGANSINRSALSQSSAMMPPSGNTSSNPALPPDHPPIGTAGDGQQQPGGGAMPEVSAAIEKAKANPQDYEAQMTAADLYYQIQRFEDSARFYEAAVKLKPGETEPMIKAGNAYFDGEKYADAEKWYTQALARDPKNIDVRTDLGLSFFLREPRDIDRAIKEYKTSLSMNPEHEITLQNLALAYSEKGDKENFEATLEKLKKVNPNNPVVTKSALDQRPNS
jgi:tetratricopeptide (TPR) repeat protein